MGSDTKNKGAIKGNKGLEVCDYINIEESRVVERSGNVELREITHVLMGLNSIG